jgi:signal peptidase I
MAGTGTGTAALRRAGRFSSGAALAVAALAALLVLVPALIGWQRYAIVSGSMSGTYDRGSLVLDEVVPVADLKVGDVITYQPPAGGRVGLITHRIAWIGHDDAGRPL